MMVETSRLPGEYYRNFFISPGESEGSGSSVHYEAEFVVSEDSSAPMKKCTELNSKGVVGFHVPSEVFPVSGVSASVRKSLMRRLRTELEQIRVLQKKLISVRNSCSNLSNAKPANIARTSVLVAPAQGKHGLDRAKSGEISPAKQAPEQSAANVMLMKKCDALLKRLMDHQYGWVFNKPVDVKALNIPDYFDVIKHPMDFGTIKTRLGSGSYSSPLEFVSDVRLTFSNAMTYNPLGNHVHMMADTLSKFFELRWKSIKKRLMVNESQGSPVKSGLVDEVEISKSIIAPKKRKIPPVQREVSTPKPPRRLMMAEEKQKLGQQLESLREDIPVHIINFLKKHCSNGKELGEEEIEIDIDGLSDDVLFSLKRLLDEHHQKKQKDESCAEACDIEGLNESGFSNSSLQPCKGNEHMEEDVDIGWNGPQVSSYNLTGMDGGPGTSKCVNSGSYSDSGDSNSRKYQSATASSPENKPKVREVVEGLESKREKIKSVSKMDQIKEASLEKPSPLEEDVGESGPSDPERSYRTAVLINRFADTILKAREKTFSQGDKDPEKLQQEREELLMQRRKEKARLQAEAKAAEDTRRRVEAEALAEVRRQRELEREAARQALLKMEKTVHIDESSSFLEDLEMLKAAPIENLPSSADETSPDHPLEGFGSFKLGGINPLEQLGLFMKADEEDDETAKQPPSLPNFDDGIEEGEID